MEFDTTRVAPRVYNETVIINKTIQILVDQAGVDARTRSLQSESIIRSVNPTASVQVLDQNAVFDGFTVDNNSGGTGIITSASGYWIFNNIISNNIIGLYLGSNGNILTQIKQNLIINNNQPEVATGNGIYSDLGAPNIYISNNKFTGTHANTSINFTGAPATQINCIIANNTISQDNSIALSNTINVKVTENTIRQTQGSSIFFGGGNINTEIEDNIIETSISNGIRVTPVFAGTLNSNIRAKNNSIQGNQVAGLNLDPGSYDIPADGRLLDATNNFWGNSTGPTTPSNPGGTRDAVIGPYGVVVVQPFLTSNPFPSPIVSVDYSTGPILIEGSTT